MPSSLESADAETGGKLRVVHVITGLGLGGTEMVLHRLLAGMNSRRWTSAVVSLTTPGDMGDAIRSLGAPVHALGVRGLHSFPAAAIRLRKLLRAERPDVVQGWLYHGNLLALAATRYRGRPALAWNLRSSRLDSPADRPQVGAALRLSAPLSRRPQAVVVNSMAGLEYHTSLGYRPREWVLIRNGVDTKVFKPNPQTRDRIRGEIGVPKDALLIGSVARFHPHKDHRALFIAAKGVLRRHPEAYLMLCGDGVESGNPEIASWLRDDEMREHYVLLGPRDDVPALMASMDLLAASSITEGFPNVVAEAMACGVPCIVTDVGDSAALVGDTGRVVPPGDPQALAAALMELIKAGPAVRERLGAAARRRIESEFSLPKMVSKYEELYLRLAQDRGAERLSQP